MPVRASAESRDLARRLVWAYSSPAMWVYSSARLFILPPRLIEAMAGHLPSESGEVLDVGCGFGLVMGYLAHLRPDLHFHGIDLDEHRVATAQRAARRLGLANVRYEVGDARSFLCHSDYVCAYFVDTIHHIPSERVAPLVHEISAHLLPAGRILIKECDVTPTYKMHFTWLLDRLGAPLGRLHYWSQDALTTILSSDGFTACRYAMASRLPYPHVLYVCQRPADVIAPAFSGTAFAEERSPSGK